MYSAQSGLGGDIGSQMVRPVKFRSERRYSLLQCLCALLVLLAMPQPRAQAQNPRPLDVEDTAQNARATGQYARADIAYGAQLYQAQCSALRAATRSPASTSAPDNSKESRPTTNSATSLTTEFRARPCPPGISTRSAPPGLVAYLRSMAKFDAGTVTVGDAAHGQTIFEGTGQCSGCHRVNGKGPRVAPDLSNIGATRTPDLLESNFRPGRVAASLKPNRARGYQGRKSHYRPAAQ